MEDRVEGQLAQLQFAHHVILAARALGVAFGEQVAEALALGRADDQQDALAVAFQRGGAGLGGFNHGGRLQHLLRPYPFVELRFVQVAQLQRRGAQGGAFGVGLLGDFGGLVVADVRVQRGDQHQAALQQVGHALGVRLQAGDAMLVEVAAAVGEQADGLQQVVDDHRLEHVELQMALAGGEGNRAVVAHDLAGQHRQRLALGRVDLAGHDRAARLVGRQLHLGEASAWA